jgi:hypothetical protein
MRKASQGWDNGSNNGNDVVDNRTAMPDEWININGACEMVT